LLCCVGLVCVWGSFRIKSTPEEGEKERGLKGRECGVAWGKRGGGRRRRGGGGWEEGWGKGDKV